MNDIVAKLKIDLFSTFAPLLKNKRCILMLYPGHLNGGDGLIWLGELELFRELGTKILFSFPDTRFDQPFIDTLDYEVMLIHGGGNFGDIWRAFNECRIKILQVYRDKTIIQLPVTIKFNDPSELERMQAVIRGARRFILTVRDKESYDLAKKSFDCEVHLAPDLAFYLDLVLLKKMPVFPERDEPLYFLRTDKESKGMRPLNNSESKDWPDFLSYPSRLKDKFYCRMLFRDYYRYLPKHWNSFEAMVSFKGWLYGAMERYHKRKFISEIRNAAHEIRRHPVLVTDRLHAHILATLLSASNILLENNYHKNRSFYDAWTKDNPLSIICLNPDELDVEIANLKHRVRLNVH